MWIITEKDSLINLSYAFKIYITKSSTYYEVRADFIVTEGDDIDCYSATRTLKSFDDRDDAKKFIADIAKKLNAREF